MCVLTVKSVRHSIEPHTPPPFPAKELRFYFCWFIYRISLAAPPVVRIIGQITNLAISDQSVAIGEG